MKKIFKIFVGAMVVSAGATIIRKAIRRKKKSKAVDVSEIVKERQYINLTEAVKMQETDDKASSTITSEKE